MEGMVKLDTAARGLMEKALDIKDWKATLGETVEAYDGGLTLNTEDGPEQMSKAAAGQLFRMVGLPVKILEHFNDAPELQRRIVRHHLDKLSGERRESPILCRGRVRGGQTIFDSFLSQDYIPIGNYQIIQAVVEVFDDLGVDAYVHKAQLVNRQLAMRIVTPEWYHDLGKNDIAYTGLAVINDEVGRSNILFQAAVARVACFNYTIHAEPIFEHSHRWLMPDQIISGIKDGVKRLNDVGEGVSGRLAEMRNVSVEDVAEMVRISGQEIGIPNYAVESGINWWKLAGAQQNLFMAVQAVQFGVDTMTERKGFHWWRRQEAEQQIYEMGKKFQDTGKLELCTCPSCHRPMNVVEMEI